MQGRCTTRYIWLSLSNISASLHLTLHHILHHLVHNSKSETVVKMGIPEIELIHGNLPPDVPDEVILESLPPVDWTPAEERKAKWKSV